MPHTRTYTVTAKPHAMTAYSLGVGWVFFSFFFSLLLPFCFPFFFVEGFGGKETEVTRSDGRTPHFSAGKCRLGAGLGRTLKAVKPVAAIAPFGLDDAG